MGSAHPARVRPGGGIMVRITQFRESSCSAFTSIQSLPWPSDSRAASRPARSPRHPLQRHLFGHTFRVFLQADGRFRMTPEDLNQLHVRNSRGQMVPIQSLVTVEPILGPESTRRFNLFRAARVKVTPVGSTGERASPPCGRSSAPACPPASASTGVAPPLRGYRPAGRPLWC